MLTNESKIILDYLISAFPSRETSLISFSTIAEATHLSDFEVDNTLKYLDSRGYVKIKSYKNGGFVMDLSHQGLHYKEFESVHSSSSQTNIFNAPVTNSAVGNSGTVNISIGISPENGYIH